MLSFLYVGIAGPETNQLPVNGGGAWFGYHLNGPFYAVSLLSAQHASDIQGSGSDMTITTYLLGGRDSWRKWGRCSPSGQVLLGGARACGSFAPQNTVNPGSNNAFAAIAGAGLDVRLNNCFA